MRNRLTNQQRAEMIEYYQSGFNLQETAEKFGIKKCSVREMLIKTGVATRKKTHLRGTVKIFNSFGYLTVIEDLGMVNGKHLILAECQCGSIKRFEIALLKSGNTKSCGCYQSSKTKEIHITHGLTTHPLFRIWVGMRKRCCYEKYPEYRNYGGRGISVCHEWNVDFMTFYNWSISNGWEEGLQIDRYPNNNGNYEPSNCRWATCSQNQRNKRNNVLISYNGETKTIAEWSEITGITYSTLGNRVKSGWPVEKVLFLKPDKNNRNIQR